MLVLRDDGGQPLTDFLRSQSSELQCSEPQDVTLDPIGNVTALECVDPSQSVDRVLYVVRQGNKLIMAEGLKGYDSALKLGLHSLVADRPVEGSVDVATTSLSDPAAFARIRAGQLGEGAARKQAYELNNSGSFAEASEFFDTLLSRSETNTNQSAEFLANQGLQQPDRALETLAKPVTILMDVSVDSDIGQGVIAEQLAQQINRANDDLKLIGAVGTGLSEAETATILDGQASKIRGTALRMQGNYDEAVPALSAAIEILGSVREGRVSSIAWLLMEARFELGLIA
jgi:tetratricopeptide (TPR) repeat protein